MSTVEGARLLSFAFASFRPQSIKEADGGVLAVNHCPFMGLVFRV